MPHRQYMHKPTVIKDLIIMLVVNLLLWGLFVKVDALELLYHASRNHEGLELDELIPLGITIGLSLLIFSYRRIKELGLMAQTLEQMSLIDPLTGLPNRRAGQISLLSWYELAERKGQEFTVFQIDLDDFKSVNDLFGQLVGDDVLKSVANRLNSQLPKGALLCRWLDDNFIVVTPLNPSITPQQYALDFQQLVSNKIFSSTLDVTCCVGFASYEKGQTLEDMLHDVGDALSVAKHKGKNQVQGHT